MIVEINDTLVNLDNVCLAKRYYQITKDPMNPGIMKDKPRLCIEFIGGKSETINFNTTEQLESAYNKIKLIETETKL